MNTPQSGNVFALILLAVVLFAALVFVFSRGLDTGATRMTVAEARAHAADAINWSQTLERSVARLIQNGVSESDISFENGIVSGYDHAPAATDKQKMFNSADGAGLNWKSPIPGQTPATTDEWIYTGDVIVTGQEDDGKSELLATLIVSYDVCLEINKQLNTGIDITAGGGGSMAVTKFTGAYADNVAFMITPGAGVTAGCVKQLIKDGAQTGSYTFFKVLIAR